MITFFRQQTDYRCEINHFSEGILNWNMTKSMSVAFVYRFEQFLKNSQRNFFVRFADKNSMASFQTNCQRFIAIKMSTHTQNKYLRKYAVFATGKTENPSHFANFNRFFTCSAFLFASIYVLKFTRIKKTIRFCVNYVAALDQWSFAVKKGTASANKKRSAKIWNSYLLKQEIDHFFAHSARE